MRKIVILDGHAVNPGDLSWERLRNYGDLETYERSDKREALARAAGAEVVLTNKVVFDRQLIEQLPALRYVGVLATGYDIIDMEAARQRGIVVTNIPAYSTASVAQMVFAHLLTVANRVEHYAQACRDGRWGFAPDFCYWDTPLMELAGKTMGIVGLGNTGMAVAQLARAFGMDVFVLTSKNAAELPEGIQKTTMEGLLAVSDVLSLHCPLTAETRGMMNPATLAKMKSGAILINTSRGGLIDEQAVADALKTGQLSAFCADVLAQEPPTAGSPLLHCSHAYITPHIAWATLESRRRLLNMAIDNVAAFVAGEPQNLVLG